MTRKVTLAAECSRYQLSRTQFSVPHQDLSDLVRSPVPWTEQGSYEGNQGLLRLYRGFARVEDWPPAHDVEWLGSQS